MTQPDYIEKVDPIARTVTRWGPDGTSLLPGYPRPFTATENAEVDRKARIDAEQDATLTDLEERIKKIEKFLWPEPATPTVPTDPSIKTFAEWGGVVPDRQLIKEGTLIYRNVAGVPLTTPPSALPGGPSNWTRLWEPLVIGTPPVTGPIAWAIGQSVVTKDKRSHAGHLWEARLDHVTHAAWAPSAATYAVWTDLGVL